MAENFKPLELGDIDEGRFMTLAEQDFIECQRALVGFRQEHGEAAKGAKAVLTIQVTLVCHDPKEKLFGVKAQTKQSMPVRPASVNIALEVQTKEHEPSLWVRASGSDAEHPAQGKLTTDDGRIIDRKTGKVK